MSTSKEYLNFVLEQLSDIDGISHRAMMGEYVVYLKGKVIGGIYDDRLLLKPVGSALEIAPDSDMVVPYDGAKPMLLADIEDRDRLKKLIEAIYNELPDKKHR